AFAGMTGLSFQNSSECGGLLVFAQGTNRVKNAEISERRGFQRFFCIRKSYASFFTKPRRNARFFV
ncbi:hypothetical protein, partial [Neisseria polysaccharea]|uniref:hypothetical protein n=1 Tax=Neisseria polysaccharea TaxID=489 RepID=UPI001BA73791